MKRKNFFSGIALCAALLFGCSDVFAQVTVTSSDSLNCSTTCTTLTAHLEGDIPTNAGITSDDVYSVPHAIGFTFNYYGVNYTSLVIGANGTLDFNLSDAGMYDPYPVTAPLLGNSSKYNNICGPWCDIDIFYSTSAGIGTETYSTDGVAPFRKFVVTWCDCQMYNCGAQRITTQIIIYETTNVAEVHITKHQICASWEGGHAIVGVQNATGTAATTAPGRDYPATWTNPPSEAWRFTPDATGATYSVTSIPYAPVPYSSSAIYWYNANTGAYLGTGTTVTVCPTVATTYKAGALGCADTSFGYYTVIPTPAGPTVTLTSTNPTLCGTCDGTITLHGLTVGLSDTVRYNLGGVPQTPVIAIVAAGGTITLTGLCPGTYDNFIVKQQSCYSLPAGPVVLAYPAMTMTGVKVDPTRCGGNDGTITLSGLYPNHIYTITYNHNGVPQPSILITSSPGGTYTITGLSAGLYDNIIAAFEPCATAAIGPFTLVDPPISMTPTFTNPSFCGASDGTITLSGLYASQPYTITYTYNGVAQPPVSMVTNVSGVITLPLLCAGDYTNIIASFTTAFSTCTTPPVTATLVNPTPPPIVIDSFKSPLQCGFPTGVIWISAVTPYSSGTLNYLLDGVAQPAGTTVALGDSQVYLTGLSEGTYSGMTVTIGACGGGSCVYTVLGTATIVWPRLVARFDTGVHYGCNGDSVNFTNNSYTINPPGGSILSTWTFGDGSSDSSTSPMHIYPQGTYTVILTVSNSSGNPLCVDTETMVLPLIHPLKAGFIADPTVLCQGAPVTFTDTSTGASKYLYSFGNGTGATIANTTYTYYNTGVYLAQQVVSNWIPCYDTVSKLIYVDTTSGIQLLMTDSILCAGTYVTFTGLYSDIGNTGVTWNFGDGAIYNNTNPIYHGFNTPGVYTVTVTAHYRACADTSGSRVVSVVAQPNLYLGPDTSICIGSESIILADNANSGVAGAHWLWSTGETGSSITVVAPGFYYATVNINNCYASDTVWVSNDCYMDIPNVFSPNGDGVNDYFFPRQYLAKGMTTFKMNIYNRWGQLIFESNSLDGRGWDGRLNDVNQPEGVYIYIIDAKFKDGQKEHHQGNITLLR